jgi:nitrogen fixation NifU-like protein
VADAADLYQQQLLAHAKAPHGAGRLSTPDASATLDNPLCGDRITLDIACDGEVITQIGHEVKGCALCQAAASVIALKAPGQTRTALAALEPAIRDMLTRDAEPPFEELRFFTPVRGYKSRHDCVSLPFRALSKALAQK